MPQDRDTIRCEHPAVRTIVKGIQISRAKVIENSLPATHEVWAAASGYGQHVCKFLHYLELKVKRIGLAVHYPLDRLPSKYQYSLDYSAIRNQSNLANAILSFSRPMLCSSPSWDGVSVLCERTLGPGNQQASGRGHAIHCNIELSQPEGMVTSEDVLLRNLCLPVEARTTQNEKGGTAQRSHSDVAGRD